MKRERHTRSQGIMFIGTWTAVKVVSSALAAPFLTRLLGADGYGEYAFYLAVTMIAAPLVNLGTTAVLSRAISEAPDDHSGILAVVRHVVRIILIGLLFPTVFAAVVFVTHAGPGGTEWLSLLLTLGIIVMEQAFFFARGVLNGYHLEGKAAKPATWGAALGQLLGVVLAFAGFGVHGVLAGILLAGALSGSIALRAALHALPKDHGPAPESADMRPLLRFGLFSTAFAGLSMVLNRMPVVILRIRSGDAEAAMLAAAQQWSEFVWVFAIAVEGIMLQTASPLWARGEREDLSAMTGRLLRYVALPSAFVLAFVFIFADALVTLYFGKHFEAAIQPLRLLVPGVFLYALGRVLWPVLQAAGKIQILAGILLVACISSAAIMWVVVPNSGTSGAAATTSAAYGGIALSFAILAARSGISPFTGLHTGRFLLLIAAMTGLALLIQVFVANPVLSLMVGALTVGPFAIWGTLSARLLTSDESEELIRAIPEQLRGPSSGLLRLFSRIVPKRSHE